MTHVTTEAEQQHPHPTPSTKLTHFTGSRTPPTSGGDTSNTELHLKTREFKGTLGKN